MNCKFSNYKGLVCTKYLVCTLNDELCPHSKRNGKVYFNLDDYKEQCEEYIMSKTGNRVRFEKRGYLYVEIENIDGTIDVTKIKNPLTTTPAFVEVVKVKDEYYIKGHEPQMSTYNNKRKTNTNID